jgi:hypothetical protein
MILGSSIKRESRASWRSSCANDQIHMIQEAMLQESIPSSTLFRMITMEERGYYQVYILLMEDSMGLNTRDSIHLYNKLLGALLGGLVKTISSMRLMIVC